MDCNIIKDLIPLYIDECCSDDSKNAVREHLSSCPLCRELYESMSDDIETVAPTPVSKNISRINHWKASLLQSVLLFISFGIITVGVALEAGTPVGFLNEYFAYNLVVPATGFMLSLANWYFIRLYKSRKSFSNYTLLSTVILTLCAFIFTAYHYGELDGELLMSLKGISLTDFFEMLCLIGYTLSIGIVLTVIFCTLSKLLSDKYAKMLGKE